MKDAATPDALRTKLTPQLTAETVADWEARGRAVGALSLWTLRFHSG